MIDVYILLGCSVLMCIGAFMSIRLASKSLVASMEYFKESDELHKQNIAKMYDETQAILEGRLSQINRARELLYDDISIQTVYMGNLADVTITGIIALLDVYDPITEADKITTVKRVISDIQKVKGFYSERETKKRIDKIFLN